MLKSCPDCKHAVSSKAAKCPYCGRKLKESEFYWVAAAIVLMWAVMQIAVGLSKL